MENNSQIEVVIKISERCNINCTYCYMFNMGNETYKNRPKYMSVETMREVAEFIVRSAIEVECREVAVVLHGGEPLLMPQGHFLRLCKALKAPFKGKNIALNLGLQTNAILVTDDWVGLFHTERIRVSVSIDGYQEANDEFRVDHKGKGTHDRVAAGIRKLQRAASKGYLPEPGALAVVNPNADGEKVYRHLVDEFGFQSIDLLLPMETHDEFDVSLIPKITDYVLAAFRAWTADDNPNIHIRLFDQILEFVAHGLSDNQRDNKFYVVTISSDGYLSGDDDLKPIMEINHNQYHVTNQTVASFYKSDLMRLVDKVRSSLADGCCDCAWRSYCKSGAQHGVISNRYSKAKGFNNASVICGTLLELYHELTRYLLNNGRTLEEIANNLAAGTQESVDGSEVERLPAQQKNLVPALQL